MVLYIIHQSNYVIYASLLVGQFPNNTYNPIFYQELQY